MKKTALTSSLILLAFASPIYGNVDEDYENPGLSAYLAEKAELPPPPKLEFPWPEGVYFAATGGGGKINNLSIKNQNFNTEINKTGKTKTIGQAGASIGYLFKEAGLFNQLDIQYMNRSRFNYTGISPFHHHIFNASIRNQTGMARLYSTLNIGYNIFPYAFLGVGVSNNRGTGSLTLPNGTVIPLNSTSSINPIALTPTLATTGVTLINSPAGLTTITNSQLIDTASNNKIKTSKTSAAGSAGIGVRFRLAKQIMLDLNYEYTYLGRLRNWNVFSSATRLPIVTFTGTKMWGHAVNFSFMLQPWGFASEAD